MKERGIKRNEHLAQIGGKDIGAYRAYNSEWAYFGIVEYPNADAQQEHEIFCGNLGWGQYVDQTLVLGIEIPLPEID